MKRSFACALAVVVACVISAPAFAQLTFNGYYRVGALANYATNSNETTAFADRLRLNISYAAPDDMYGFKLRLQADSSDTSASGTYTIYPALVNTFAWGGDSAASSPLKYGYGYMKFLDGALKVSGGYLDVNDYSVTQSVSNPYFGMVFTDELSPNDSLLSGQKTSNFQGLIAQVFPIENLSVAGTVRVDGSGTNLHDYGVAGYYMIPEVGKILVNSQFGIYNNSLAKASDSFSNSYVSAGFSYTGFEGLTASAVYRYFTPNIATNTVASNGAVAIVEYKTGPLFADVAGDFTFTNTVASYIEGEASYLIIPQIKVRAYGAYYSGGPFQNVYNSTVTSVYGGKGSFITGNLIPSTTTLDQYLYGLDLIFPIIKAGELDVGVNYGDQTNFSFPLLLKINF
jgi:hypothetical protein